MTTGYKKQTIFSFKKVLLVLFGVFTMMNAQEKFTNELIYEDSPYLQQHAHNPVDWYAWGDKAFKKAKEEKKLIFLHKERQ